MRVCFLFLAVQLFLLSCTPTNTEFFTTDSDPEQIEAFSGKATLIPSMMWLTYSDGNRCRLRASGLTGVIWCNDGRQGVFRFLNTPLNHVGTFEGILDGEKIIGTWWRSPIWPR